MFGLIGLFGALFIGFVAEGVMSNNIDVTDEDDSTDDIPESSTSIGGASSNILEDDAEGSGNNTDDRDDFQFDDNENGTLAGYEGTDQNSDGQGNSSLLGDEGDNILTGGNGDDLVEGRNGDDVLIGGLGNDALFGNEGDDQISGVVLNEETGEDTDVRDYLNGNAGDDLLVLGYDDIGTGGEGNDTFALGEWFHEGTAATITDFNPDEDTLVVHYSADDEIPEVSVETEDGNSLVLLDGVVIARLLGNTSFDISQISLIGT
ncbi:calcium-binding protein [Falsihalocynthiibacter arcticus]|uniref:Calcium-binding protein n=1 Tax=Falsihalocynthiibacter arcticus TaxID=1579316 RepID=A0A126UXH3_9RHOB|nr:hypothetical protein [Falsihalocynthiibacter arcticus]AML50773.1 hypothetical protein RC74_05300 [Falsihalocynthiibacter arcticus]